MKFKFSSPTSLFVAICLFSLISLESQPAHAQQATETILYGGFSSATGEHPCDFGSLVMDASGNLYGTTEEGGTSGVGTVFELVNSSGSYSEKVLHNFANSGNDGIAPLAGLIMDASGNLYGTTDEGGTSGGGTVFELVNSSGSYSEKVLYSFTNSGGDGLNPHAGLIMDASGNLYGTTYEGGSDNFGTVFELVNSSGTYSEKVLHSFASSGGDGAYTQAGLIMDASGNLYGTTDEGGTSGGGTVFELVNSSGSYSEKVLYSFTYSGGDGLNPYAGLIMDASGNLYGTTGTGGTSGRGTVFELVNSSGSYSEKVLYSFTYSGGDGLDPYAGVIMDASGNLYGTTLEGGTSGDGTVFELVNSSGSYSEKVLYSFTNSGGDGLYPYAGVIMDASGNLYGTTFTGGNSGYGTVFEVTNATALSVSSNPSPSNYGQPVTFTATISDAFGNVKKRSTRKAVRPQVVTGTVTWSANTGCGTTSMTSGTATCTTSILPVGDDTVTANYSGNHNAASGSISQTVDQATTSINVTAVSPSSEAYGQDAPATITAVLSWSGSGAAPTAANVIIGGNGNGTYGITSCGSPSGDTMTCAATYTPNTNDTVGTYTETATFSGDSNYTGSISPQSGNFAIAQAGSGTITVSSSQNPSAYGQSVTFTATIPGQYGAIRRNGKVRSQVVTGTVTWSSNTGCGTTPVTSGTPGTTTCMTSSLSVGSDTVTASYSGDSNHNPGSGSISQTVNSPVTTINVTSVTPSSEDYGADAPVTITAVLSWTGSGAAPTAANVIIGGNGPSGYGPTSCGSPSGDTMSCMATYTPSTSDTAGTYTETATFSGDSNYSSSTSPQSGNFVINNASSTVSVSSSLNPSGYAQAITFTATINGENNLLKGKTRKNGVKTQDVTGTVTWSANTGCGTTAVTSGNPGTAICATSSLPVGNNPITATYSGDGNHSGSTGTLSGGQTVNQASQTITFTTPPPTTAGYNTSFTVVATASSGLPVTYTSSGVCTNSGATYTITAAKGTCSVQVNQSGNSNYLPAPTLTANVTATKATPVASFTGAPASAVYGATFTVTATANSGITPTITASGACTISGTTVTMTTGTGTCTMTAKWAANADYNALSLTQKTKAEPLTPEVSFTGAPASAANGTMFTVTATSNESGSHASVPTITASGACTAGAVSNNGPGSYEATITITKNTGTCTTTAKWAKTIEYAAETLTQKTTAQK